MHIGLNLIYLVPGETGGMETYARELIPAMLCERPDLRLTAFLNRETAVSQDPWREMLETVTVPVQARQRWEWVRGEQQLLPGLARRAGVDLVHSLASTAPAWGPFRRVVTIHDVIYRLYPEAHQGLRSHAMRVLVPLAARRSHRIVVPSHATRDDLIQLLHVPTEKIDVVPNGVRSIEGHSATPDGELRARLELGDRSFVLSVSAKRPHKNLVRLVEALALVPRDRRPVLVVTGYATPHEQELHRHVDSLGLQADVRILGWVSDAELEGLYRGSVCFVFPSLYEGFGLPVLEAMARGVPVACSDRGALAEVVGAAALVFDPTSTHSIARAIEMLVHDEGERRRLSMLGIERASRFSWEETARGTLATYERVLVSV